MGSATNDGFVYSDGDATSVGVSKDGDLPWTDGKMDHPQYPPGEHRRMMRNVIIISISFMFLFTAYQSISTLQRSINPEIGTYSLSTIYGSIILSSFFLPTFIISKLTAKWTLFLAMFGYLLYIASQFYPEYWTVIPAAVILGLCAAPLWSAKCLYLTHVGHQYGRLVNDDSEVIIVRFFGIFFLFFQSASVWGNIISSQVLSSSNTGVPNYEELCGLNFCPWTDLGNATLEENESRFSGRRFLLSSIYLVCALIGMAILFFFVDSLKRFHEVKREGNPVALMMATFKNMKRSDQLLLIPLTIWSGMEQGFLGSDYTAGFVTCTLGVGNVGYVMICYGICDAISSVSFQKIIRIWGRLPVFFFGAIVNFAVLITFFVWDPNPDQKYVFFILAGLWGIADGIWQCEINAFYGVLFADTEEAAFSNYRLWESLGFVIAYINSTQICVNTQVYILLGTLSIAMIGYTAIEVKNRKKHV